MIHVSVKYVPKSTSSSSMTCVMFQFSSPMFASQMILPGMNTSPLSPVWLVSTVANGDDTKEPAHSRESAAAAR